MALAKKCDICGAFYEHNAMLERNGFMFCKFNSKGTCLAENAKDCCPKCISDIEECLEKCKNRPVEK